MELNNRVVIITGASMGIGEATARAFVQAGARVVLAARSAERIAALAGELGPERALAVPTDVTSAEQVQALVAQTLARWGRIDVLVNNAGVGLAGEVARVAVDGLRTTFDVNVIGPLLAMQAVVPHLRKPGGGIIINVSSMVTKLTIPGIGGYRASKKALDALTENARLELARDHIRVLNVFPTVTETAFFDNTLGKTERPARMRQMRADSAEHVANRIVAAARDERRDTYTSAFNRLGAFLGVLMPQVLERVFARGR